MKKSLLALVLGSALVLTACDQAQKTAEKAQAAIVNHPNTPLGCRRKANQESRTHCVVGKAKR